MVTLILLHLLIYLPSEHEGQTPAPIPSLVVYDPYIGDLVMFDAEEQMQSAFVEYQQKSGNKAFALSPSGQFAVAGLPADALYECIAQLTSGQFSCFVYDVNDKLVADDPVWLTLQE
jgi:hypothetical protein